MIFNLRKYKRMIGFLLTLGLIFAFIPLATAQDTDGDNMRTLTVVGSGSASGTPDIAYIDVGIEVGNTDVGTAVDEVNQTMDDVISALSELGIPEEDIRTTNFNIRQEQQPAMQSESETSDRYIVSNTAELRVSDISQLSDVIQTALDAGANRMYGLQFSIDDSDALMSEARQNAADDAMMRAEELAQIFGVTLGNPIEIDESGSGGQPVPVSRAAIGGGGGPVISEGQLSVTVQLHVTYEIINPNP